MGRPRKVKNIITTPATLHCLCCGEEFNYEDFCSSDSLQYQAIKKLPYCQNCLQKMYQKNIDDFEKMEYKNPQQKAMERLCMALDLYYDDTLYEKALVDFEESKKKLGKDLNFVAYYIKHFKLRQYCKKTYNTTIASKFQEMKNEEKSLSFFNANDNEIQKKVQKAEKFFGSGFSDDDYLFLQNEYDDWTTRHECQTKSQEEVFKQICFTQLKLLKATRAKADTKDLSATFLKQLEAAKLQPKQNKGDTTAETQTFGTLIDKWENTRPIPEIDEDLRDVDKIGLYLDVFFKGHLAKMMNLKNGLSRLYEKYMEKYTVKKPEYSDDEDGEALFDAIFGNSINEDG